nr:hypothetical protein [Tanacetum cinerariifolium]
LLLPHVPTESLPTVIPSDNPLLRQYTKRTRIAQSLVLPPVADEPASPLGDGSQGEACLTDSGFVEDQDRVIEFRDSYEVPTNTSDTTTTDKTSDETGTKSGRTVTLTAEDMQKKKNDAAILKTFSGNETTKKTKKNLLKQQYENFRAKGSETFERTFSILQVIVGQLQFMDIEVEQDDLNQKFLTSLAPEWLMHTIVWRNRSDLDTISLDDLYNHLKLRIQQYLQHEHYALWEVIEFEDSYVVPVNTTTTDITSGENSRRTVTLTAEDMQKKKNDVKARTTLLLSLPDEHQLRFSKYKTARELWAAILKTFDGNEATKKTKKNLLK